MEELTGMKLPTKIVIPQIQYVHHNTGNVTANIDLAAGNMVRMAIHKSASQLSCY